jgi:hypothetical protein
MPITLVHTDDCFGGDECAPVNGVGVKPHRAYVREAVGEMGEDALWCAPWCQVRRRAWEIAAEKSVVHTDDCFGGDECEPVEGEWMQPPNAYVSEAVADMGDGALWCHLRMRAWEIMDEEN